MCPSVIVCNTWHHDRKNKSSEEGREGGRKGKFAVEDSKRGKTYEKSEDTDFHKQRDRQGLLG